MKIKIDLTPSDVERVQMSTRFISDRLKRPGHIKSADGKEYIESYVGPFRRKDMYWVDLKLDNVDLGAMLIDPSLNLPKEFTINRNYCKVELGYDLLQKRVREWFYGTEEYQKQVHWTLMLVENIKADLALGRGADWEELKYPGGVR